MRLNDTWSSRLSTSASTATKVGRLTLICLAALGGLHVFWQFMFGQPPDVVTPARSVVNKSSVVSAFAQDYVATWLTATASNSAALTQFVSVNVNDLRLPSTQAVVISAPTVVAVTYEGDAAKDGNCEVFSVVVGVNERPYESASPARALYRVPVLWSQLGPRAASLPARVEGPGPGADLPMAYPATLAASDNAFQVVSGFISAYLTGDGSVDRYVTSDSKLVGLGKVYQEQTDTQGHRIPLVTGVTATSTPPTTPAEGQAIRVLAQVVAVTAQYAEVHLVYPLTLRGVGGHWSVAAIDRAPVMSQADDLVPIVAAAPAQASR
uniref:Conjugative transposon protein TcpC n=1 Tax=Mycobacterium riyadhense TaxID=486698 RepID=A0A653EZC5_9MYCO|nr:Conjugative transposon protein TcpC [Mycobacterium riyadhense]